MPPPKNATGLEGTLFLPGDLKTLTSLRFFAAIWVFLFHLGNRIELDQDWFWTFIDNGARGVDFFFILSGFVIFHVYEGQIATGKFSLWRFMVKRIARLLPLHLLMIAIFALLGVLGNDSVNGLVPSVLLLHAWATTDGLVLNGPSWTISAEMCAYLLFGLVVVRTPPTWLLILAFAVSFLAVHFFAVTVEDTLFIHLTWDFGALRIIPLFILGMLLRRLAPQISHLFAISLGVLGIVALAWIGSAGEAGYEILIPFVLLILSGARLSDQRWLPTNHAVAVYLGEISYAIYMIHMLVIKVFIDYLPKIGLDYPHWGLICVALVVGSSASYHLIESPSRRYINGLVRKPNQRQAKAQIN